MSSFKHKLRMPCLWNAPKGILCYLVDASFWQDTCFIYNVARDVKRVKKLLHRFDSCPQISAIWRHANYHSDRDKSASKTHSSSSNKQQEVHFASHSFPAGFTDQIRARSPSISKQWPVAKRTCCVIIKVAGAECRPISHNRTRARKQ